MKIRTVIASAAAVVLGMTLVPASTGIADAGHNPVIVPGDPVEWPLGTPGVNSMDVDAKGNAYLANLFTGGIYVSTGPGLGTFVVEPHNAYALAVSQRAGTVYYAEQTREDYPTTAADLWLMSVPAKGGTSKRVANIGAWYKTHQTDGANRYGFVGLPASCASQFTDPVFRRPAVRRGSDVFLPSAAVAAPDGVYIADSLKNVVMKVTYSGAISLVAVLPPEASFVAQAAFVDYWLYPSCAVGYRYIPEPRPTGIARGSDGKIYVTTVPDGAAYERPTLRGGIYRIDPATGVSTRIIGGLTGATSLAITPSGTLYVAEARGGSEDYGEVSVVRVNSRVARSLVDFGGAEHIRFQNNTLYLAQEKLWLLPLTYE